MVTSQEQRPRHGVTGASGPAHQAPPIVDARRRYVELYGSALVMTTYLRIAVVCLAVIGVGLVALNVRTVWTYEHVRPLVIRIDDVGRAQAVHYDALTYTPQGQAPELKYFLTQFVTKHFARMRATVKAQYGESLYFLSAELADGTIAQDERTGTIEAFLTSTADEIDIHVKNVALEALSTSPYTGIVDFEKVYYAVGTRHERARDTYVARLTFVLRDELPNALIPINPLGLTITHFRVDQAFE